MPQPNFDLKVQTMNIVGEGSVSLYLALEKLQEKNSMLYQLVNQSFNIIDKLNMDTSPVSANNELKNATQRTLLESFYYEGAKLEESINLLSQNLSKIDLIIG